MDTVVSVAPDHPDQCTAVHGPRTIHSEGHNPRFLGRTSFLIIRVGGAEVVLTLRALAHVKGSVFMPNGSPAPGGERRTPQERTDPAPRDELTKTAHSRFTYPLTNRAPGSWSPRRTNSRVARKACRPALSGCALTSADQTNSGCAYTALSDTGQRAKESPWVMITPPA